VIEVTCGKCRADSLSIQEWGSYCPSCGYYNVSNPRQVKIDDSRTYRWLVATFSKDTGGLTELQDKCRDLGYTHLADVPKELAEVMLKGIRKNEEE